MYAVLSPSVRVSRATALIAPVDTSSSGRLASRLTSATSCSTRAKLIGDWDELIPCASSDCCTLSACQSHSAACTADERPGKRECKLRADQHHWLPSEAVQGWCEISRAAAAACYHHRSRHPCRMATSQKHPYMQPDTGIHLTSGG